MPETGADIMGVVMGPKTLRKAIWQMMRRGDAGPIEDCVRGRIVILERSPGPATWAADIVANRVYHAWMAVLVPYFEEHRSVGELLIRAASGEPST